MIEERRAINDIQHPIDRIFPVKPQVTGVP